MNKVSQVVFLCFGIIFNGCSEEDVKDHPNQSEWSRRVVEDPVSIDESIFHLEENKEDEEAPLNLSGCWESKDRRVKFEIIDEGGVFYVEADYDWEGGHPESFSFKEYDSYFEYEERAYKIYFEGSNPYEIRLLWREIDEDGFHDGLVLFKLDE